MERREFLRTSAAVATALAASGQLPLLAAEKQKRRKKTQVSTNTFTEPSAIEPITGYLPKFVPSAGKVMSKPFKARYSLITCSASAAVSKNSVGGQIDVSFGDGVCKTTETRNGRPSNVLKTAVQCKGELNTASKWTFESEVPGRNDLKFVEEGLWNGKVMTVKSKSWTQEHATSNPLISRWALLPIIASGAIKNRPLSFDMMDDSTLRSDQTLRYEGEIEVPIKGGVANLESYVQIGWGIVPTHYLVDGKGRVQLITMSAVNWALTG